MSGVSEKYVRAHRAATLSWLAAMIDWALDEEKPMIGFAATCHKEDHGHIVIAGATPLAPMLTGIGHLQAALIEATMERRYGDPSSSLAGTGLRYREEDDWYEGDEPEGRARLEADARRAYRTAARLIRHHGDHLAEDERWAEVLACLDEHAEEGT